MRSDTVETSKTRMPLRLEPRRVAINSLSYLVLALFAIPLIGPLIWMLVGSLKTRAEVLRYPPTFIPEVLRWENYQEVFVLQPFHLQFRNSVVVTVSVCVITIVISSLSGYALARLRPPGGPVIFLVLLSGIFLPAEATIIPLYRLASALGWIDSLWPLIIFTSFTTTASLATFIMRQAFISLPAELGEAAEIDGASQVRVFAQIYLPLVRPSLAAVVVLAAWHSWNQYLEPLIYLRQDVNFTVPLALAQYVDPYAGPLVNIQLAATVLSIVPLLVLFVLAQRHVVSGLTAGALK